MSSSTDDLARNDLVYELLPSAWVFGLPVGNGQVGGMAWVEDETKVVVTLDSSWAWDLRCMLIQNPETNTFSRFREVLASDGGDAARLLVHPGLPMPTKTYVGRFVTGYADLGCSRPCWSRDRSGIASGQRVNLVL